MTLVAGIDSSTQSCKVVVRDAGTGALVRHGSAPHPAGTEADPADWEQALHRAVAAAGGIDDVAALSVGGQQHGAVCLDEDGNVVRPAMLWNDTRSAGAAEELVGELGAAEWVRRTGSVPVASFTVTKLRWMAGHEPANARRIAAVCLPHDWLTWRLRGAPGIDAITTDRSDASGTGYFDPVSNEHLHDLVVRALGHDVLLPRVLAPSEGLTHGNLVIGPGAGDNAAAAIGVGAGNDAVVSLGTSGTAFVRSDVCARDVSGSVAGFADATGAFLPLVCTLNAAQVLDAACTVLGVDHHGLARLAMSAHSGADGLVMVPYLNGERTPNLPFATGGLLGLTLANMTPANIARAAVEGILCGIAGAIDALRAEGAVVDTVRLVGGAASSPAVRAIAPGILGVPVLLPVPGEYVADGAARQAAWALTGELPQWPVESEAAEQTRSAAHVRERYAEARQHWIARNSD
ncbi:MAG: xylulose kinase [Actinobacteria bacterium]|nr:xylulose kinase [Actinomycetota bacterium]